MLGEKSRQLFSFICQWWQTHHSLSQCGWQQLCTRIKRKFPKSKINSNQKEVISFNFILSNPIRQVQMRHLLAQAVIVPDK